MKVEEANVVRCLKGIKVFVVSNVRDLWHGLEGRIF